MKSIKEENQLKTKWFHFIFAFLAGVFLANTLPHFINGISGNEFPTPFADPPGVGLSLPVINVLWATINFVVGLAFLLLGKVVGNKKVVWLTFFVGFFVMAFYLASYFGELTSI